MTTYVDGEAVVREWVNGLASLVGQGNPLPLGASLKQREGAASVPYGLVLQVSTFLWGGSEHPSMGSRISMQIYGPTKESASDAAVAYCEALMPLLQGQRVTLTSGATIAAVDSVDGPQWAPDINEPRYVIDCDFLFA